MKKIFLISLIGTLCTGCQWEYSKSRSSNGYYNENNGILFLRNLSKEYTEIDGFMVSLNKMQNEIWEFEFSFEENTVLYGYDQTSIGQSYNYISNEHKNAFDHGITCTPRVNCSAKAYLKLLVPVFEFEDGDKTMKTISNFTIPKLIKINVNLSDFSYSKFRYTINHPDVQNRMIEIISLGNDYEEITELWTDYEGKYVPDNDWETGFNECSFALSFSHNNHCFSTAIFSSDGKYKASFSTYGTKEDIKRITDW